MPEFKFEIVKHIGIIAVSDSGWSKEVNLVSWNGGPAKIDIRSWNPTHDKSAKLGTYTEEEARTLAKILADI